MTTHTHIHMHIHVHTQAFFRAVRLIHPDKQAKGCGVRHMLLCQGLFMELAEAYKRHKGE